MGHKYMLAVIGNIQSIYLLSARNDMACMWPCLRILYIINSELKFEFGVSQSCMTSLDCV